MRGARHLATMVLLVVGAVSVVTSCKVGATAKTGAGESTDICHGYRDYNAIRPPDVHDLKDVKEYVTGVQRALDRIDRKMSYRDLSGHRRDVPTTVLQQVGQVKQAYSALQGELKSVNDQTQLAGVAQRFANSAAFTSPDTALELWIGGNCA